MSAFFCGKILFRCVKAQSFDEAAVEDILKTMHPGYQKLTSIYNTSGNGIDILPVKFRVNNGVRELEEIIAIEVRSKRIGDPNDITTGFFEIQTKRRGMVEDRWINSSFLE